jgi:hypothetical protein
MSHEYLLWLTLFAYAWHIAEEYILDNVTYAQKVLKLKSYTEMAANLLHGLTLICAFSSIMIGWKIPYLGLFLPAYYIFHGLFVHVLATIRFRKMSPGVFTTIFLGLPISIGAYWGAWKDGVLTWEVTLLSFLIAALILPLYMLLLKIRKPILASF